MLNKVKKNIFSTYVNILFTYIGFFIFKFIKKTPNFFYQAYVKSYCLTNAKIKGSLTKLCSKNFKINNINQSKFLSKNLDYSKVMSNLKNEGYHIFEEKISEDTINKLIDFSKNVKCDVYNDDGEYLSIYYDSNKHKVSSKYEVPTSDILNNQVIKEIALDDGFKKIASLYLNTNPIISDLSLWWSPVRSIKQNYNLEIKNQSAQMFHFDLDRISWLKLFIYLSDTDENSGPHEFVKGSHNIGAKPTELLKMGYNRLSDKQINDYYNKNKIKKILGKKGTMFIGDTSCYHRGHPPIKNDRLLLVIEFSNSMFGASYKKINII